MLLFNIILIPIFLYIIYKTIITDIELNKFKNSIGYLRGVGEYYWLDRNNKKDPRNIRFKYISLKDKAEALSSITIVLFLIIVIVNGINYK